MKLAVIFPYKNREYHRAIAIPYINYFLLKHEIEFELFVIESLPNLFNRGLILNAGFSIIDQLNRFDYVCLHDIDMLPIICDYSYEESDNPVHLATGCSQFSYKIPYKTYFGGINLFTINQFKKINGFSNRYWIWGNEDDDLLTRCENSGYSLLRRKSIHQCFDHSRDKSYDVINKSLRKKNILEDGLSTLQYNINLYNREELYHHYTIDYDVLSNFQLYEDK